MTTSLRAALATAFLASVAFGVATFFDTLPGLPLLVFASVIGGYMALNIGANDVANNVGPAVGSLALSMGAAIVIAAIFEAAGALIAGGDVVQTVKKGIIDPTTLDNPDTYIWLMLAALLGGAIWLNIATVLGAPVSTTHSIVGGVMGAGIAAQGWGGVNWDSFGAIAASWVVSPLMGGVIAALLLLLLKRGILFREDILPAAARIVPLLLALMAWAFSTYLLLKGARNLVSIGFLQAVWAGLPIALLTGWLSRRRLRARMPFIEPSRDGVNSLFTWPLIFAAALLSFAHGANDVANAVGPLAGIFDALSNAGQSRDVAIPLWVMLIGAAGLALGLALYGPRLIRTVGSEITELDRTRAFCIALSAALTVIAASQLGLPVSSTHVALGAVFGVGFLREFLEDKMGAAIVKVLNDHGRASHFELETRLHNYYGASAEDKKRVIKELKQLGKQGVLTKKESKKLRKLFRRKLVKRQVFLKILAAWLITVPISAALAAGFFYMIRGIMLP